MHQISDKQKESMLAILKLVDAIVDLVKAKPLGLPSGELYAQLMSSMSLNQYQMLIQWMVDAKRITVSNNLIQAVK